MATSDVKVNFGVSCPNETDHRWKLRDDQQSFVCVLCNQQVFRLRLPGDAYLDQYPIDVSTILEKGGWALDPVTRRYWTYPGDSMLYGQLAALMKYVNQLTKKTPQCVHSPGPYHFHLHGQQTMEIHQVGNVAIVSVKP